MRRNPSEKSVIHCERVTITATPRKMFMVASVTMMSGMCSLTISRPFNAPSAVPRASVSSTVSATGSPALSIMPASTPHSDSRLPTERSMPPIMMTMVMPSATMPLMVICWAMTETLLNVLKLGAIALNTP